MRFGLVTTLLLGLLRFGPSWAAPQVKSQPAAAAASAGTAAPESLAPEELARRKEWSISMHKKTPPKKGCFSADYPATEWREVPCVPVPNIPFIPRRGARPFTVGNGDDIVAVAPSGTITQAIGHFENIVNVTSETGMINNTGSPVSNAYSLQINTNTMASTACSPSPNAGCQGWEQWVYFNSGGSGSAFIQYWLIDFDTTCPSGWITFPAGTHTDCFRNNSGGGVAVPNQPITSMGNWTFGGAATTTGDSVSMGTGSSTFTRTGDNAVAAAAHWTDAEFNIFGPAGGSQAVFNSGAQVDARTEIIYGGRDAPTCSTFGSTGETNNLSFGPTAPAATGPGPAVIFQESTAGGSASNCAAASTIGDTHLRTFGNLYYDFQAAGDFTLAEVAPGFEVQTRQVSGAPAWPDATVNKAVAVRVGKTQVAVCLLPGNDAAASVMVDGKATPLTDGTLVELADGGGLMKQGSVYQVAGADGSSVSATVNSYGGTTWIDVNVGLGRTPAPVKGLIVNANGNVNQIAARDGAVLTNPFSFDDLYHHYADSWRVSGPSSMLSVCGAGQPVEVGIPKRVFTARNLAPDARQKAHTVCTTAGVAEGALLEACTLDVAVIGRREAARVFVTAVPPAAVGTITGGVSGGGGGGGLVKRWWWLVLILLGLVLIVASRMRKKP